MFRVILSYSRHTHWISDYWTIVPRGNIRLGSSEPPFTTLSSADQHRTLFYVRFCLKSRTHTVYWTHIFSVGSTFTRQHFNARAI